MKSLSHRIRIYLFLLLLGGGFLRLVESSGPADFSWNLAVSAAPEQASTYAVNEGRAEEIILLEADDPADDPTQSSTELAVDDGSFEAGLGLNQSGTLYCINRLQPQSYPATLTQLRVFFRTNDNLTPGSSLTVVVGANPDGDQGINGTSFQQYNATVSSLGAFNLYDIPPFTINSGDFVVGFRMQIPSNVYPGALDTSSPSGRSYVSTDGFNFTLVDDVGGNVPDGDLGIRAIVSMQPTSLDALLASYSGSGGHNGSGDLTILRDLAGSGQIAGNIVTQGDNSEIVVAPNGQYAIAFPTGNRDSVSVITGLNQSNPFESRVLNIGNVPNAVAITPDGSTAIVVNAFGNPVTYRLISGLPFNPTVSPLYSISGARSGDDDSGAEDVALSPSGDTAIVSLFHEDEVAVIDGIRSGSPSVRRRIGVRDGPNGVAFAPDGDTAFVACSFDDSICVVTGLSPGRNPSFQRRIRSGVGDIPQGIGVTEGRSRVVVTNTGDNNVSVFRIVGSDDLQLLNTIDVGAAPAGLALSADGTMALVANSSSRTVSLIRGLDTSNPYVARTLGPSNQLDTAGFAEQSVAFAGSLSTSSILDVSPTTLDFSTIVGGGNPPSQQFMIRNLGNASFSFSLDNSNPGLATASPTGGTVFPGQQQTVTVSVNNPNQVGTRQAFLTISVPGAPNSPLTVTVNVTTTGAPSILDVTPTSLSFATQVGQTTPPSQSFLVRNTGSGSFSYSISNSDPSLVSLSPSGGTVFGGQSQTVTVVVTPPQQVGTRQAFLTITAPGAQNSPRTVTVTVTTTAPAAILDVTPTSLSFSTQVGQGNPSSQSFQVRNTGSGSFNYTVSNSDPSLAGVSPSGGTVFGGQSQTVTVFVTNPNQAGTRQALLTITAPGAQNSPRTVTVTVTTTSPPAVLDVSPTSLNFTTQVGQTSPPSQSFLVRNIGSGSFTYSISNSNSSLVSLSPSGGTVFGGQSQTVTVFVTPPTQAGTRQATLTITAPGAQNSPRTVTVTVTTTAPPAILDVTPTSLNFTTQVGQGNPPSQTFLVRNTGSGSFNYTVSNSDPSLASVSPSSGTVFGGQSQTVTVFVTNPNQSGTRQALLTITAPGAQNSPRTVTVTVTTTGQPAILNVTPSSLTFNATVGQGNPPAQQVTVRNNGGGSFSYSIASNSGFVSVSPSSGFLSGGQQQSVQVSVSNPNTPGTVTAQLTFTAPGAQNSPQVVTVTIITQQGGGIDPNEPNDSPQTATFLNVPFPGQSTTITGVALPNDPGTNVTQLNNECQNDGLIQDWFRLVINQRDAYRVTLDSQTASADFDLYWFIQSGDFSTFPEGVQLFAFSAQGPGQQEVLGTRVLEPGTYFIGVRRLLRNDGTDFQPASYTLTLMRGLSPESHAIEDVACVGFIVDEPSTDGYYVVNRVRPTTYPARLESISALFFAHPGESIPSGRPVRMIAFTDPTGSGTPPFNPSLVVNQTIIISLPPDGRGRFNTLNLGNNGPVIQSGDFYVGYIVDTDNGIFPDAGRALNPNTRSFASVNGGQSYQTLNISDPSTGQLFNVAIRASVNTRPFGKASSDDSALPAGPDDVEMALPRVIFVLP